MPALCKRRGKSRWRAQIKERGKILASKWFGTGPVGGPEYRRALLWEEKQRQLLAEQAKQEQPEPTPTASLTVRDWANARLDEVQRRRMPATYTEARTAFKHLGQTFAPEPIAVSPATTTVATSSTPSASATSGPRTQ